MSKSIFKGPNILRQTMKRMKTLVFQRYLDQFYYLEMLSRAQKKIYLLLYHREMSVIELYPLI